MIEKFIICSDNEQFNIREFKPDDTAGLSRKNIVKEYAKLQKNFIELQKVFYASKKYALLIILQGMDCSGKDGT